MNKKKSYIKERGSDETGDAGDIKMTAAATAPAGWLLCNGAQVSRTTYSRLFAAIGGFYGSGNGTTTFTLPDFRGRVPAGVDSAQTDFNARGKTGGAKTHTLTETQIPSHSHTISVVYKNEFGVSANGRKNDCATGDASEVNSTWDSNATGGGQAHNNLQPYLSVNFVIKY
jgi:microcystin-dependent protein